MKKFYFIIFVFQIGFAQFPDISFNGTNNWSIPSNVNFDTNQNQVSITSNGSNSVLTSITKTISNPPSVFYLVADFQLQNVILDPATIKNPNIVIRNQAGNVIYRFTMKDNLNLSWFKAGIKIENYTDSQITIEFGVNKASGTMLVKNPLFTTTPPDFIYEFPFNIPNNTTTTLNVNLSQKHNFENDLLSSNTHFVFANTPWSNSSLQQAINNSFPMSNLRFPGGTVGNYYNYNTDNFYVTAQTPTNLISYSNQGNTLDYNGYKNFVSGSGATSTYMLNVMQGTVQTAKNEYLNRYNSGLPIKWIELGNEMYLTENQVATNVTDVNTYISHTQQIASEIKSINPNAKVAICAEKDDFSIGEWNQKISQNQSYFDAATMHNYIATDMHFYSKYISYGILTSFKRSMKRFTDYNQMFPNKPLLLTEWGITGNVIEPYFIQTLGIADIFLAIEKANQLNIVKQAGIHMLYKNNSNDTATLMYFNNGNLMLTSKGKLYSKLFEVFKNSEVYNADAISSELETDLKAVNVKMVKKGSQYKIFAVNKLPVTSNLELNINGINFKGNFVIESYSDNLNSPTSPILASSNSWNIVSANGNIVLPASSISIITINITIWNGSSWTNNSPTSSMDAVIDGDLTTTSDLVCKDLTINSGKTLIVGAGKKLTVTGNLINNGTLIFKSDATGTAMFDVFNGTQSGSGRVTVERYIPARRAFRFLSSPVTTTTSINTNWQESNGTTAGLGTHITGSGGISNGFDATATNNPSLFTHDNSSQTWSPVLNTNTNVLIAGVPYRVMVRGDRTINLGNNAATPSNTTLRATGTLVTGTKAVSNLNTTADGFSFIGNPYQAPVNMQTVLGAATNLKSFYYAWDPTLGARGAYVSRDVVNGITSTTSAVDNYLQPGQACFVQTVASGSAALSFTEASKYTTATNSLVFRPASFKNASSMIRLTLFSKDLLTASDGAILIFDAFGDNTVDSNDASKMTNLDENLAIKNSDKLLSIEHRASAVATDEIQLDITQYRATDYTLEVEGINAGATSAYLFDKFNKTYTEIPASGKVSYNYSVDMSNKLSSGSDRFKIVFNRMATEGVSLSTVNDVIMYPNPSTGQEITLSLPAYQEESKISISDLSGNILYTETIAEGEKCVLNPKQTLPQGIYLVSIKQANQTVTKKLIVK